MSIIFLNGCTSAGKTSIARALQAATPPARLRIGIDDGFALLPADHPDGYWFDRNTRGLVRLNYGVAGRQALASYRRAAAVIALDSLDLIVDEVVLEAEFADDWVALTSSLDVFAVGVHCDLAELERRELARGDRRPGQARGQRDIVHTLLAYDIEIDTTTATASQSAATIDAAFKRRDQGRRLRRR